MLDADAIDIEDLPATLREMAALIGLDATIKLVRAFAGVRLYVPREPTPEHLIARLVGFEAMARLCSHYGSGEHFDIPRALAATIAVRNREIRRLAAMGKSQRDLARQFALTERHIRNVLSAEPLASPQEDLFSGKA